MTCDVVTCAVGATPAPNPLDPHRSPLMKKLLLLVAAAAGAVFVSKKMKDQQAEKDLWATATENPPAKGS